MLRGVRSKKFLLPFNSRFPYHPNVSPQHILCVRRETLEHRLGRVPVGFVTDAPVLSAFRAVVREDGEFLPRPALEEDPTYVQVIVQGLISNNQQVLALFRRSRVQEARRFVETRHNGKVALASGGHVEPVEAGADDILVAALRRELNEELVFDVPLRGSDITPLGIICNAVPKAPLFQRVHIGMVYLVVARGPVRLPEKSDEFDAVEFCGPERLPHLIPRMEEWGQLLAGAILERQLVL